MATEIKMQLYLLRKMKHLGIHLTNRTHVRKPTRMQREPTGMWTHPVFVDWRSTEYRGHVINISIN